MAETHEVCADALERDVLGPVGHLLKQELTELTSSKEEYLRADKQHQQHQERYAKVSKKRETEKVRFEANASLFEVRKHRHSKLLDYGVHLNQIQMKRRFMLHGPLLRLFQTVDEWRIAASTVVQEYTPEFCATTEAALEEERRALSNQVKRLELEVQRLLNSSELACHPDIDPLDPFLETHLEPITPRAELEGWLNHRSGRLTPGYVHCFVRIRDHSMHRWTKKRGWTLLTRLTSVSATIVDRDDRRYLFEIARPSGLPITLQAEGARSLELWVACINYLGRCLSGVVTNLAPDALYFLPGARSIHGLPSACSDGRVDTEHADLEEDDEDALLEPPVRPVHAVPATTWSRPYPPPPPPPRKALPAPALQPRVNPFDGIAGGGSDEFDTEDLDLDDPAEVPF